MDLLTTIVDSIDFSDEDDSPSSATSTRSEQQLPIKKTITNIIENQRALCPSNCTGLETLKSMEKGTIFIRCTVHV
jgi:hypothetical protein